MRQLKIVKSITPREAVSLDQYLREAGRYPLLTAEEEVELAQKIKEGNQAALDKLCNSNLRFVVSVAKQYQNQGLAFPDLINEGNLGLIKAATKFDETRGFKFISYAVWWIRQSILQGLAENSRVVRLPLNKIGALDKAGKAFSRLQQKLHRDPLGDEIAEEMEIPMSDVEDIMKGSSSISIDRQKEEGATESSWLHCNSDPDSVQPDRELIAEGLLKEIERIFLQTLSPREADVVRYYYGIGVSHSMTLEEIGEKLDLTRERVRQIKEKAIIRLKRRSKNLKPYLGY